MKSLIRKRMKARTLPRRVTPRKIARRRARTLSNEFTVAIRTVCTRTIRTTLSYETKSTRKRVVTSKCSTASPRSCPTKTSFSLPSTTKRSTELARKATRRVKCTIRSGCRRSTRKKATKPKRIRMRRSRKKKKLRRSKTSRQAQRPVSYPRRIPCGADTRTSMKSLDHSPFDRKSAITKCLKCPIYLRNEEQEIHFNCLVVFFSAF